MTFNEGFTKIRYQDTNELLAVVIVRWYMFYRKLNIT